MTFYPLDESPDEAIDNAYRAKYSRYGDTYVKPMTGPDARAATLRLDPADLGG